jgi:PAS domain S-box-containing protein
MFLVRAIIDRNQSARRKMQAGTIHRTRNTQCELDEHEQVEGKVRGSRARQLTKHGTRDSTRNGHVEEKPGRAGQALLIAGAREAQAESNAARDQISAILESITDAFFSTDCEWRFTYVNKEAERLMRKPREALLGRKMFEAYPDADHEGFNVKYRHAMDNQAAVEYEAYYAPFETWFSINAYPVEGGGLSVYFRDITARKQAETERLRLAAIVESSEDAILSKTLDGVVTSWNRGAEKMYGYTSEEIIGRSVHVLVPVERHNEVNAILGLIRKGVRVEPYETVRLTKRGEQITVSVGVSPVLNEAGVIVGASAIARDMTARRRAEKVLEEKERHFRSIVMSLQEGLVVQDASGCIVECNESAEQVLGLTRDQLIGRSSIDPCWRAVREDGSLFPGENHPSMVSLRTGEFLTDVVMGLRKPDETLTWISINSHPLFNPGETAPYAVAVTFSDITERRAAEAQIRIQTQVLDQIQAGIVVMNMERKVTQWNAYAEKLYGWKQEEVLGRELRDLLIMPPDLPQAKEVMEQVFREGYWEGEFTLQRKNGTTFPAYVIDTVIRDVKGAPIAVAGISMDISERNEREQQLQRQVDHLAAMHSIDKVITASLDLPVTLDVILEQVTSQLQVDASDVLLLNPHTQSLEYAAGRGFRYSGVQKTRMRLGEGFAGRAALERRTIHMPDILEGRQSLLFSVAEKEGFVMYHGVPLIARGQVQGVLEIVHRSPMDTDVEWLRFADALAKQAAIAIDNATLFEDLQRSNTELALAYDNTLAGWSRALDLRDNETEGHTQRVTDVTVRLARSMNVAEAALLQIQRGALLHDIGKMGIPDSILLKPGPLTDEEWVIMRKHPVYAYELLSPISFLRPALDIPYCHHEKWDGTGYPRGLKGEQIPLAARIFAVVDVYDALRSDRPYRKAWPEEQVLAHIRELSGTHFDSRVVEAFLELACEG